MSINLKIEKKDLWLLSAIIVFLIGVMYAVAYNPGGTGNPVVMGHSYNELENVQYKITNGMTACAAANQAIKTINSTTGAVTCEADDNTVSGLVTGGGRCGEGSYGAFGWGTGSCSGNIPVCTSGNTVRETGYIPGADSWATYFICVRN